MNTKHRHALLLSVPPIYYALDPARVDVFLRAHPAVTAALWAAETPLCAAFGAQVRIRLETEIPCDVTEEWLVAHIATKLAAAQAWEQLHAFEKTWALASGRTRQVSRRVLFTLEFV